MNPAEKSGNRSIDRPSVWRRARSWIRYGTSLRIKLIVLVLVLVVMVIGALYGFALSSLRSSISGIYEGRARSVASVISKSIVERDYILYYSEEFNADIDRLMERYDDVVGIRVIGRSARGFLVVASTDPARVGSLISEAERTRFEGLHKVETRQVAIGGTTQLRAYSPLFSDSSLVGVVVVDMSLVEQTRSIRHLSMQFGLGTVLGSLALGGLLSLGLSLLVTRPVGRLATAATAVSERDYNVEVTAPFRRIPGTKQRDEVSHLVDGFNLMAKMILSHEQELLKLVVLDELTGAYTLDHLRAELERELAKTRRYKHPTSLLLVEIDGLADRPPEERDRVLVRTASFLVGNLRNVDVLYRVSDRRFVCLLPETPPDGASVAAERLLGRVADVTRQFTFPLAVRIEHFGWIEHGASDTETILSRLLGPIDGVSA